MLTIGITGGVGSGKSEVLNFLEKEYKALAIRTDLVARELMTSTGACFGPVAELFGPEVIGPDGEFDRAKIAAIVFRNETMLEKLNGITHPAVRVEVERQIAEAEKAGLDYVFLESALLLEEKYDEICNDLWYVYAEVHVREQRLMAGRGYSIGKTHAVMNNQLPEEVFRSACHFVLDNSGAFEKTAEQIVEKMSEYKR